MVFLLVFPLKQCWGQEGRELNHVDGELFSLPQIIQSGTVWSQPTCVGVDYVIKWWWITILHMPR